jgi:two-component system chemotaxis sensor kinase CheA
MVDGGGGRMDAGDKVRDEFLSEAQELIDGLGRDLLKLEEAVKSGHPDPEIVNDVFRAVHTLKGLSGLFGVTRMAGLSHQLEDVLDDLRLGRIEPGPQTLDLLFRAVAAYGRILAAEKGQTEEPAQEVEQLLVSLGQVSTRKMGGAAGPVALYDLDPGLFGVLTEYEEHRLRTNVQQGLALYRIRARFPLSTIDSSLEELKAAARPHGEIITYLPTGSGADADAIELEILMASRAPIDVLRAAVERPDVTIEEVRRRLANAVTSAPPAPTAVRGTLPPPLEIAARPAAGRGGSGAAEGAEMSLRSVTQTVRVDIRKLDRLMTIVGELAIVKTAIAQLTERARRRVTGPGQLAVELQRLNRTFERHLAQMQGGILEVRMVPLGQVFDKLARVVRQISREHDREVNLVVTGAETEIDKLIVEELSDPLMHIIRNAIGHGIEGRAERLTSGKPAVGTIALNAFQKGNHVVIEIEDDGAGMNPDQLVAAAVRRGLLTGEEARALTTREVLALVFMPGFTTTETATDLSGRGMGLDVVKTNMGKLGGVVDIASELGIGTKITITLPITLAIISVLLVEVRGRLFAVPLANVEEAIAFDAAHVRTIESREVMSVRGTSIPLCRLGHLFDLARDPKPEGRAFVVIARIANRRLGFVVDELVGQQDIVIKPLGRSLRAVRGFSGATELADQRVALVLDVGALTEEILVPVENRFFATVDDPGRRFAGTGGFGS